MKASGWENFKSLLFWDYIFHIFRKSPVLFWTLFCLKIISRWSYCFSSPRIEKIDMRIWPQLKQQYTTQYNKIHHPSWALKTVHSISVSCYHSFLCSIVIHLCKTLAYKAVGSHLKVRLIGLYHTLMFFPNYAVVLKSLDTNCDMRM